MFIPVPVLTEPVLKLVPKPKTPAPAPATLVYTTTIDYSVGNYNYGTCT